MFYSMYCACAKSFTACTAYAPKSDKKYVLQWLLRMRTMCQQIFASVEIKFNTIISALKERYNFGQDLH